MKPVIGDFSIDPTQLPEWEDTPPNGLTIYQDSKVFQFKCTDGFFNYVIRVLILINYERNFTEETFENPCVDEITDYSIHATTVRGTREYKARIMGLLEGDLKDFDKELKDKITINY